MFRPVLFALLFLFNLAAAVVAQEAPLQAILQDNHKAVERASRKTVEEVVSAIISSGLPQGPKFLKTWADRDVWMRESDGLFFYTAKAEAGALKLIDIDSGEEVAVSPKKELSQLKPNSGVRGVIASALVATQLTDPNPARRMDALIAIERGAAEEHLEPLRASIDGETNPEIKARKERILRLVTITYGKTTAARVEAAESFATDLGVDARAAINPVLTTKLAFSKGGPDEIPASINIETTLKPGASLSLDDAYALLVAADLAPKAVSIAERKATLEANISNGMVGGIEVSRMGSQPERDRAYSALVEAGIAPPFVTVETMKAAVSDYTFYRAYDEADGEVTTAAAKTLQSINNYVGFNRTIDLALDGLSMASIFFLAAIGLAITFGVMGVINMAHGEFIMIGAYTGYVVQQFIPNYTFSIIVALPLAFLIAAAAGIALERLVIRHLASRPLETLLATFGVSIALQQLAKNIFGTQARPLTSPAWLDGALSINDVVSISYIRIAIFVLALVFFALLLFVLNKTRLGLEVRAVTQNPRMASSMGINPDRINMLTFGLGSGIAGIAGVAIGLFAKVTSELGSAYIVQSFMTVVVGGVGNIWGTLAGATMIGSLQKIIEFFNPSNTLAAQTYMIIFIIIFIQFKPKGIIALKGRAAGD